METVDELYDALLRGMNSFGAYKIERKKTSIHILRGRAFVGVHPKKSYLGINVVLDQSEAVPAAAKVERVSSHRYHHYYKIASKRDLSKSFFHLLKQAYDLSEPRE